MGKIPEAKNVEYLAFEGGGGKGVTYLGAIRALEKLKVLPIDINNPGKNQIKGISGASAGAITALLLAMGLNSAEIEKILSRPQDFNAFFDSPLPGIYRSVNKQNKPEWHTDTPQNQSGLEFVRERANKIKVIFSLAEAIAWLVKRGVFGDVQNNAMLQQILKRPEAYIYNLIFDRGIFPGMEVRHFFSKMIAGYLDKKILEYTHGLLVSSPNGGDLTFELFNRFTGIDLVVTGTNVTKHRPSVFSKRHTPKFPVAEAVAISMNLPFLFKPVYVEANVPINKYNRNADDYHGYWVDGGVLNNLPLHAFDEFGPQISDRYPDLRVLHPGVLGLRLTANPQPFPNNKVPSGRFDTVLRGYGGDVMESILYPSEGGQIRSQDEAEQTIDLLTYDLVTTEFAPPASKRETPVREAEKAVLKYFETKNR